MREFILSTGGAGVQSASCTLIAIAPKAAPNVNIEMLRWWCGQTANATSAQQRISLQVKASAYPTLVAQTARILKIADANAFVLVGSTNGTAGTTGMSASAEGAGAYTQYLDDAFNVLNGWLMVPTPPETLVLPASYASLFIMQFPTTPSPTSNWSYGCQGREV